MTETTTKGEGKTGMNVEDRAGFALFGLGGGLVGAFVLSYFVVVPALVGDRSLTAVAVMTVATLLLMIVGGAVGYYCTRRPVEPRAPSPP